MAPKLYMLLESPPVRAVLLCAKALGVELEHVQVNVFKGEQYKPEFLKLNPQHTVPVLEDDGFVIWDSHVIMPYLISKYSKGHALYPEDIRKRAVINQRLHFNSNTLFPAHFQAGVLMIRQKDMTLPEEYKKRITDALDILEIFLQKSKYIAENDLSIADFSIWTTTSNLSLYFPLYEKRYSKIISWMKLMDDLPYSEINRKGTELARARLQF